MFRIGTAAAADDAGPELLLLPLPLALAVDGAEALAGFDGAGAGAEEDEGTEKVMGPLLSRAFKRAKSACFLSSASAAAPVNGVARGAGAEGFAAGGTAWLGAEAVFSAGVDTDKGEEKRAGGAELDAGFALVEAAGVDALVVLLLAVVATEEAGAREEAEGA